MKKLIAFALIVGIFQNWDKLNSVVFGSPGSAASDNGVVLYATDWCGYCQKTRELFAGNDIPYVEVDIEKSEAGYREYKRLGGRGVPVVNAHGTVIHGFAPQPILEAAAAR